MDNHPKYTIIANSIREDIQKTYTVGERLPSEPQLAKTFHVSRPTIRQAMSILEKQGFVTRTQGSGTYVNRIALPEHKGRTNSVGVIITRADDYIFPNTIQGIEKTLRDNGYSMILSITQNEADTELQAIQTMLENNVCGLIIEPSKSALPNLACEKYQEVLRIGLPCLFLNGHLPDFQIPCVALDDLAAGHQITSYLIERGHTRITGIFKSDDIQGHLRYYGFAKCMYEHSLPTPSKSNFWYTTEDMPEITAGVFDEIFWKRIQGSSAVVCYNDRIAKRLKELILAKGFSVPEDFSLISIDNSSLAELCDITSVNHPESDLGIAAARGILTLLEDPTQDVNTLFPPKLVERGSVGFCGQAGS